MTGDHDQNGAAEQSVQKSEDELRVWKDATEDSIGAKIPATHPILTWMLEHAMSVDRRTAVGEDGRTPLERIRGRRGRDNFAEFGEKVMYMPLRGDSSDKKRAKIELEPRFLYGVYLGLHDRTDEIMVWNEDEGIRKARTIKRFPEGQRFD